MKVSNWVRENKDNDFRVRITNELYKVISSLRLATVFTLARRKNVSDDVWSEVLLEYEKLYPILVYRKYKIELMYPEFFSIYEKEEMNNSVSNFRY